MPYWGIRWSSRGIAKGNGMMVQNIRAKAQRRGSHFIADRRGMTSIEMAVMFGVIAIGFTIFITPYLTNESKRVAENESLFGNGIDNTVTGSIPKSRRYTIRRSVLQPSKSSRCIIFSDGRKYGDC